MAGESLTPLAQQVYAIMQQYVEGKLTGDQVKAQLSPILPSGTPPEPVASWIKGFLDAELGQGLFELISALEPFAPLPPAVGPPESILTAWDQLMQALAITLPGRQKVMLRAASDIRSAMLRARRL